MPDKGPYGKSSWNLNRQVKANPELCRSGSGTPGNSELRRGTQAPNQSELFRKGKPPATMPEIDRGGFRGMDFHDRVAQNEAMTENQYDNDNDLIPGHKQMAGMP
jgi:hypothetical protein